MASSRTIDLTKGSVLKKLIVFTFPIFITSLMQQLYHAADVFVVGNFAGTREECDLALAAVGATGSVTSLLLNVFAGISVGTNVLCAQARGSGDREKSIRVISTSLIFGFLAGLLLAVIGYFLTPALLEMIKVPVEIREESAKYMRIIFLGQPASLLFNFCAAVFRARGDTKKPMKILTVTGMVNVLLNLFFVICLDWDTAGVAMATVIASVLSVLAALVAIFHPNGDYCLSLFELRLYKKELLECLRLGIPVGLNSVLFQFSNTIVATAANSLGTVTVAAVSASNSVNNVAHTFGAALDTATLSFAGQNCGAGKLRRVDSLLKNSLLLGCGVFLLINTVLTVFPEFFLGLFTESPEVIAAGIPKLMISAWGYMLYLCGQLVNACNRGFGKSFRPTLLNIICICFLRIAWVWWVFPLAPADAETYVKVLWLYLCLPVSWGASCIAQSINYFCFVRKKEWKKYVDEGRLVPEDMDYYNKKVKKSA